jgi:hypothetical protein
MTLTLTRPSPLEYRDELFEDDLIVEMRLAELVIALSGCSAKRAFRLVRRRGDEQPLDRLARALAATRAETLSRN